MWFLKIIFFVPKFASDLLSLQLAGLKSTSSQLVFYQVFMTPCVNTICLPTLKLGFTTVFSLLRGMEVSCLP